MQWVERAGFPPAFATDFVAAAARDYNHRAVTKDEFRAMLDARDDSLRVAFISMDRDWDGCISHAELEAGLKVMVIQGHGRYGVSKALAPDARKRIVAAALKGQQRLDFSAFKALMFIVSEQDLKTVSEYRMQAHWNNGSMEMMEVPDKRKQGQPCKHLIAGGIAGAVSKTVTSPLDVVTAQARVRSRPMLSIAVSIWRTTGVAGFYKANLLNSAVTLPWKACDFYLFDLYKRLLSGGYADPSDAQRVGAGALAGATTQTLLYPVGLIINRKQVIQSGLPVIQEARAIYQSQGVRGFYAGLTPSLIGIMPYAGVSFGAYEVLSRRVREFRRENDHKEDGVAAQNSDCRVLDSCFCGAAAGWFGMMCAFPLATVRARLAVQDAPHFECPWGRPYTSTADALRRIAMEEGALIGLFSGVVPSSIKIVPAAGVSFGMYEYITRMLA